MAKALKNPLLLRLGLAMTTIVALVFIGMLSSVFTAEMTQGYAAAINQAGSLRMQAYRIATNIADIQNMGPKTSYWDSVDKEINEFEKRLHSPKLVSLLANNLEFRTEYNRLVNIWETAILPMFIMVNSAENDFKLGFQQRLSQQYLAAVDSFVVDIDQLVMILEEDTESKIQNFRLIQVIILFLTLGVASITMYLMNTVVLSPLRDLLLCAQGARRGDFSVRAKHVTDNELGQLGYAFNLMAEDLSKIYTDLEGRVRTKTSDLERSNRSLELLYNTITHLREGPLSEATYSSLLKAIEQPLGIGPGTICLMGSSGKQAHMLASTYEPSKSDPHFCSSTSCAKCIGEANTHVLKISRIGKTVPLPVISIPIKDQGEQFGVMLMEIPPDLRLEDWQRRLLEAVAHQIGVALNIARRNTESHRLSLFEERSVIARELHDSLAQSLSYLKIQLARLDASLNTTEGIESARAIVTELRKGVSSAYKQLRELLTTFRLSMDGSGLRVTLENTVQEFMARSDTEINLENKLDGLQVDVNEEIHIHQIIREALSNVVQHAHAKHALVNLYCDNDDRVTIVVEDDGIGLSDEAERKHHYGLAIMKERASGLGGNIQFSRRDVGGTRMALTFTPTIYK
jgi:two-component system nitrate/nitrite sensor histidine kinase NarX